MIAATRISARTLLHWALLIAAAALVAWIRLVPLSLGVLEDDATLREMNQVGGRIAASLTPGVPAERRQAEVLSGISRWREQHPAEFNAEREKIAAQLKSEFTFQDAAGHSHVLLGDMDSYHWLRMARNYLRTGTTCDAVLEGQCRDTYANAPMGRAAIYHRSLHIAAIVALHRLIAFFKPAWPLQASSYLVPVLIGVLGVFPAFALGKRVGGELGGLCGALLVGTNPLFLSRSIGSDDDVWNVVLPLFVVWAASEATSASRARGQIGFALLAGLFVGLDAATWTGWALACGVVFAALAADLAVEAIDCTIRRYSGRTWSSANLARATLIIGVFYVAAGISTMPSRGGAAFALPFELIGKLIGTSHPMVAAADTAWWPGVLGTVAELAPIDLHIIEFDMAGRFCFLVSTVGLLLLVLPRTRWRREHPALLVGAVVIDLFVASSSLGRVAAPLLLALPIFAGILIALFSVDGLAERRSTAFLIIAWFFTTLFLSFQGRRFAMLMAAPLAVGFGSAIGRLEQLAVEQISRLRPSLAWFAGPAIFIGLAAVLILPVKQGYETSRNFLPAIDGVWWKALNILRDQSPSDAIVNTWWDYGYWIEYVAERRVNNDGASLNTHIPYWTGAALAAPSENESAGLLRMLDCGSDATPEPEGKDGAYGKLVAYGMDGLKAEETVTKLAAIGRTQADAYLAEQNLDAPARADILRSTHCTPPPSYLVVSTRMRPGRGWWSIANWDFRKAYIVRNADPLQPARATAELTSRFGMSGKEARTLNDRAAALRSESDEAEFIASEKRTNWTPWLACNPWHDATMICRTGVPIGEAESINGVVFRADNPAMAHLLVGRLTAQRNVVTEARPGVVLIADAQRLVDITNPASNLPDVGILIDLPRGQARLDSPGVLRSTFSRLMYLDGRYDQLFEKVYDQTSFGDERLTLWKINWQRLQGFD